MTWHAHAACSTMDPAIFFPERGDTEAVRTAKAVCAGCPVILECREENLAEREGIFGGMSAKQRREYRSVHGIRADCLHCGTEFRLRNTTSGFCSEECRKARHRQQKDEARLRAWWSE